MQRRGLLSFHALSRDAARVLLNFAFKRGEGTLGLLLTLLVVMAVAMASGVALRAQVMLVSPPTLADIEAMESSRTASADDATTSGASETLPASDALSDFVARFQDAPAIEPPQLIASALRQRYLPNRVNEPVAQPFDLTLSVESDLLAANQSSAFPVVLDQQLVALETMFHQQLLAAARFREGLSEEDAASAAADNEVGAARSRSPLQASGVIGRLRLLIRAVVYAIEYDLSAARQPLDQLHACVTSLQDDATLWEQDAVVACLDMLERRLIVWEATLAARQHYRERAASVAAMSRVELLEWTVLAREFLLSPELTPHGERWITEWKIDPLLELLRSLEGVEKLTHEQTTQIHAATRELITHLDPATFTSLERRLLKVPGIPAWRKSLVPFTTDLTDPLTLLQSMESFELAPTLKNEQMLRTCVERLAASPHRATAELGATTLALYRTPNVKLYLSVVLLNHLLPAPGREYARFRDVVAGRDVSGRRRTDTNVTLAAVPSEDELKFTLNITGRVAALGTSSAMATTLQSISSAEYVGSKTLQWTDNGFVASPAVVSVNNTRTSLRSVQPGMGFPLLGGMMSNAVRSQYEFRQDEITAETKSKIVQQARTKINSETESQFAKINEWYRRNAVQSLHDLGLTLQMSEARADTHWLLPAWRIGKPSFLAAYPPAPETPQGAFADFKIHESTVNILIDSLDIAGKTLSIGELRQHLIEKTKQPGLFLETDHDNMSVCLAEERPIRLRLHRGCIEIALSVAVLKYNNQTIRNFEIFATYVPQEMGDGTLHLVREGIVRLGGDILPRHQIPLRTIFGTVFAARRTLAMTPEAIRTDTRFEGLTTGMCRIENGWFAVALVLERDLNSGAQEPSVTSAAYSQTQRPRRSAR